MNAIISSLSSIRYRGFFGNKKATVIVEFALTLPFLIFLYIGCVQACDLVLTYRKVTLTTQQIIDLTSREVSVNDGELRMFTSTSRALMAPYSNVGYDIVLTQVTVDDKGVATVDWSFPSSANVIPDQVGDIYQLPDEIRVNETSIIVGTATYEYKSLFGGLLTPKIPLSEKMYMYPRISQSINKF
jgi:Flp pilus assembly protein TadG